MTDVPRDAAAELAWLTMEIDALADRLERERQRYWATAASLQAARHRRAELAAVLRPVAGAPVAGPPVAGPPGPASTAGPAAVLPAGGAPPRAGVAGEASTRTVQNVLFVLGGLLLATAAVVFTAVAWARYGVTGRAVILAVVTAVTLATPLVALWRRLRATAETFAALGLLLVVLDGYAAWYVDLLGVAGMPATRYAGLVAAVTAALAAGYRALTRLTAAALMSLVAAQPALPLVVAEYRLDPAGWALVFVGVAALDLAVVWWWGRRTGAVATTMRVGAWVCYGAAVIVATVAAVVAEIAALSVREVALAGLATVGAAAAVVAGGRVARSTTFQGLAGTMFVLALTLAASQLAVITWPDYQLVLVAAVVAAVAGLVAAAARVPPAGELPGVRAGALLAAGALGLGLVAVAVSVAGQTIGEALPMWHADLAGGRSVDWQVATAVLLGTAGLAAALPRPARAGAAAAGCGLAVLALPGSVSLPWWAPSVVDLAAGAVFAVAAALARWRGMASALAASAAVLGIHAALASLARPELTAATLGALVLVGGVTGAASGSTVDSSAEDGSAVTPRRMVGGGGIFAALLAGPAAVGAALVATEVQPWWVLRLTVAAVGLALLALAAVRRWWPPLAWYGYAAVLISAVVWPIVAAASVADDPAEIYAGVGLVFVGLAMLALRRPGPGTAVSGVVATMPPGLLLAALALPAVGAVLLLPYSWLSAIWTGAPAGAERVGLAPPDLDWWLPGASPVTIPVSVALALLAVAAPLAARAMGAGWRTSAAGLLVGGPVALVVALAAASAPWPSVAAASLLLGLGLIVVAAIAPVNPPTVALAAVQAVPLAAAGLAGSLPVRWSTLTALGLVMVATAGVGAGARALGTRVCGWVAMVATAVTTAVTASLAADLRLRAAAFAVLAVAAAALAGGSALAAGGATGDAGVAGPGDAGPRRRAEGVAIQAGAHAAAGVALLLTVGSTQHAAAVCTLWGIAVGLRALWPGTGRAQRSALASVAAASELLAWWLLMADQRVALIEAYTLPLAAVALLAGFAARHRRPDLRSWLAYGPALLAGFLPSLATVVGTTGDPWRRLALGAGALAVVVVGSVRRQQAPVVIGGVVLSIVALHELALVWRLLPGWVPLGIGGLILVGLAITYERRRRDLARLTAAVGRMH